MIYIYRKALWHESVKKEKQRAREKERDCELSTPGRFDRCAVQKFHRPRRPLFIFRIIQNEAWQVLDKNGKLIKFELHGLRQQKAIFYSIQSYESD